MQPKKKIYKTRTLVENHVRVKHYITVQSKSKWKRRQTRHTMCVQSCVQIKSKTHFWAAAYIHNKLWGYPRPPGGEKMFSGR